MMGRCCCFAGVVLIFDFGSLTIYMVASTTCGSIIMVTRPTFVMVSFGGFLGSSMSTPLRL